MTVATGLVGKFATPMDQIARLANHSESADEYLGGVLEFLHLPLFPLAAVRHQYTRY